VNAQLASLRPLQPWVGTLAVMDGRAQLAITGRGSLADPILEGTMRGDALRSTCRNTACISRDACCARALAERTIFLEEFSFVGGNGKFTAKGTLAQGDFAADARCGEGRIGRRRTSPS
jgi:translocation and assembly module TamB